MTNCKSCKEPVSASYCANCGHPVKLKRIDSHYIIHEITHVLHFEKGILYTVKELLMRPGKSVREFISDNRNRLVKPVIFLIVSSLIYSVTAHFFHIESYMNFESNEEASVTSAMFKWGDAHAGYANLIMSLFIAFWIRLFFHKKGYNLYEILILLCFVTGISMMVYSVFALIQGVIHTDLKVVSGAVGMVYCTWAIGNFFESKEVSGYLKAFLSYILGLFTFSLSVILIGTLMDFILH